MFDRPFSEYNPNELNGLCDLISAEMHFHIFRFAGEEMFKTVFACHQSRLDEANPRTREVNKLITGTVSGKGGEVKDPGFFWVPDFSMRGFSIKNYMLAYKKGEHKLFDPTKGIGNQLTDAWEYDGAVIFSSDGKFQTRATFDGILKRACNVLDKNFSSKKHVDIEDILHYFVPQSRLDSEDSPGTRTQNASALATVLSQSQKAKAQPSSKYALVVGDSKIVPGRIMYLSQSVAPQHIGRFMYVMGNREIGDLYEFGLVNHLSPEYANVINSGEKPLFTFNGARETHVHGVVSVRRYDPKLRQIVPVVSFAVPASIFGKQTYEDVSIPREEVWSKRVASFEEKHIEYLKSLDTEGK
ncbi:MAG: hypothetical protein ACI8Y7_000495 [Candidatus Woesearchaeota archaeon]|jgi:hypothetical protein